MDLGDLRIFKAVVDEGGVTRAAEKLHRVQSNVTTRVRQLEEALEVQLFVREGRRLRPTPAGRVLYDYADKLLRLAEQARAAVRDPTPRGPFRLGAMESTAAVRLPRPLTAFMARYPEVEMQLSTGNPRMLATRLLSGELDAAFFAEPVAEAPFESIPAFVEALVLVSGQGHPPIDADALPKTIIVFEHGCPHRRQLEGWYEDCRAAPAQSIQLSSYHAMLGSVVVGMGVALLPRSVLDTFPEAARLRLHPLPKGRDQLVTHMVWRRGAASPAVAALADMIAAPGPVT